MKIKPKTLKTAEQWEGSTLCLDSWNPVTLILLWWLNEKSEHEIMESFSQPSLNTVVWVCFHEVVIWFPVETLFF